MQIRTIYVIFIVAVLAGGSRVTLHAQSATALSDSDACSVILPLLSSYFVQSDAEITRGPRGGKILGAEPTPTGIHFRLSGRQELELDYKDVSTVRSDGTLLVFDIPTQKNGGITIDFVGFHASFWRSRPGYEVHERFAPAFTKLVSDAHAGYPYDCHSGSITAADTAKELADFEQKTAAWRATNPKPPVSDEVTKRRLLAEDAVQQKNFGAAVDYYRVGITIDPTWAPGWYNSALISAELKNYSAAALYMKHYLILLPEASDAAAAKERVLLWEAKAEEASRK
jgi:hypothetical protein